MSFLKWGAQNRTQILRHCQWWVQGDNPAGHTIAATGQDAIGLPVHPGTPWLGVSFSVAVSQHPQAPFCSLRVTALKPLCSKPDLGSCESGAGSGTLPYWRSHRWPQLIDPVHGDLSVQPSCPPANQQSHLTWCVCKLTRDVLSPLVQIFNKDAKQDQKMSPVEHHWWPAAKWI